MAPICPVNGKTCDYGGSPESVRDCYDCPTGIAAERDAAIADFDPTSEEAIEREMRAMMAQPMGISALGVPKTFTPEQDHQWVKIRGEWMPVTISKYSGGVVMPGRVGAEAELEAVGPGVE